VRMTAQRFARLGLLVTTLVVAVTAAAGGAALIVGSLDASLATVLSPPVTYLGGSPFDSYLVPGIVLAAVLGGLHLATFVLVYRRHDRWILAGAIAAFDALIWIFVQMMFIPFSFLQAFYFAIGLAEVGLVMLALGILIPVKHHPLHRV
jgi:hypothetical protein